MKPVNLAEKLTKITDHWSPKIIGRYNENDIMVVKVQGNSCGTAMMKRMIFFWC